MTRSSRGSILAGIVLLAGVCVLSRSRAFAGLPAVRPRDVAVSRAGAAKDGIFTPTVMGFKVLLGEKNLEAIRGFLIKAHGDAQAAVIETHETEFGQGVMQWLFNEADVDGNGTIDKAELKDALQRLGFEWMDDDRVDKLFKKADKDGNDEIDLEEFKTVSPKFIKQSLIKLAKKNGADLGFLS
eukprot:TRINITY_DN90697_c0_g1_i1.p1 TRINITY_DN90697_c0_g1~~TRINITY_DN90697_c0_g1_i1.p1  ORF type:complete len:184 (+),score=60.43 TRINITY_DN90697_c0_g1_i1:102-653(+)